MALTFQNLDNFADIDWGLVKKIEVRQQGTGSFLDVGAIGEETQITIAPITRKGDPANTDIVTALQITLSFAGVQTAKANELAMLTGTSGTGLYETDVEVRFTFASERTLTFGATAGYPLRIVPTFNAGSGESAQTITYTGFYLEPFTSTVANWFSS